MAHFWLEFDNQGHRQRYDFDQASVSIGREAGSDFFLDHPTVSRQHALIVENYGNHQLVVLSRNGLTAVDGQVVTGTVDLRPGMTIQVGEIQVGFRAAIGGNGADVGEVATEAFALDQVNTSAPTAAMMAVDESTEPSRGTWDAPAWNTANPGVPQQQQQQQAFGGNPGGSGFGQMPVQQGFGQNPNGSGFGQMPMQQQAPQQQPQNGHGQPNGGFQGVPAPAPPPKGGGEDDEFKIKSWEEIAAEAATGAHESVSGMTDFERIQKAQAKAQKKGGTSPALLMLLVVALGGVGYLTFREDPKKNAIADNSDLPDRCKGLKICYPEDQEPTCANKSDCEAKALTAYNVADELYQKKGANITNRYEAYKQLDKAGRFLAKAGLDKPPETMKDYDARLLQYEEELEKIAGDHRIRHHQLQQRKMNWEQAENVRAWQAYFPDSYNVWFQEAIETERRMKDSGSWPPKFDPKPKIKKH